jgi:hypothetical protein
MRIISILLAALLLAGCAAQQLNDMANNRFMDHDPEQVPAGMAGGWTGTAGPYLMTMRLQESGSGVLCNSYGASNYLQAIKYSGGTIYIQDGTRLSVTLQGDTLAALAPYMGAEPIRFRRDANLAMAAPYCRQNL